MAYERELEEQRRKEEEEAAAKAAAKVAAKQAKRTRVRIKNYNTLKPTRLSTGVIESSDSENEMKTPVMGGEESSVKMMSSVEGFYDDDSM